MKKLLSLIIMSLILFSGYTSARCIYDSKGHLIYDDTIRGRKRAAQAAKLKPVEAAAAAKIDYDKEIAELDNEKPNKSNYIQRGTVRDLPQSTLKSNYIQSRNK